jgi:hypothetical protein
MIPARILQALVLLPPRPQPILPLPELILPLVVILPLVAALITPPQEEAIVAFHLLDLFYHLLLIHP